MSTIVRTESKPNSKFDAVQQLTFGAFTGFVSGYALRQGAKVASVALGTGFVFIQGLAYLGYVDVKWRKIERVYYDVLDADQDGKITANDFSILFNNTTELLKFEFPSGAGFSSAFAYGLTRNRRLAVATPLLYAAGNTYALGKFPIDLGISEKYGFSAATDWLKTSPFKSENKTSLFESYLKTKSYRELAELERDIFYDAVCDDMLLFLDYEMDDKEVILPILQKLKQQKKPWYYL
eukprot:maker-scaffold_1-snap-gene-24.16-mRNA-1 protein AED:0.06 eAED:0.06 QI:131/1/1/1/1/1/5/65/236